MLPNSVKREGAYSEGGNDVAGGQGLGDGLGRGAAHKAEPVEHWGWDIDRQGSLKGEKNILKFAQV